MLNKSVDKKFRNAKLLSGKKFTIARLGGLIEDR
jgi:hypothetical protein